MNTNCDLTSVGYLGQSTEGIYAEYIMLLSVPVVYLQAAFSDHSGFKCKCPVIHLPHTHTFL